MSVADDNADGGKIILNFDPPAEYVYDMGFLDNDYDGKLYIEYGNGATKWITLPELGDNAYEEADINLSNVRRITFELTGKRPPKLSVQCAESVRRFLATASRVFEFIRHEPECDGKEKCHRRAGCRKSIINSNYLIKKALLFYYKGDRRHKKYRAHREWLPGPSRENRHRLRLRYFQPMVNRVGGEWKKYWPKPNYF